MPQSSTIDWRRRAWVFLALAGVLAVAAWEIPARWRSLHPAVVAAAGRGTPGLVELALVAAAQQRDGLVGRLNEAAIVIGLPRTNEVIAILASNRPPALEVRILGGPDPALAALLPPLTEPSAGRRMSAREIFLPAAHRTRLKATLGDSRSPGVQSLLQTLTLPTRQFVPAHQPGGQPLEAVVLLAATLYERERLSSTLARELRDLAEQAPGNPEAQQRLEEFYLNLLSLARRLDWTSLAELTRKVSDLSAFDQFANAIRTHPEDLALLYASALMSGNAGGVAQHLTAYGDIGRQGLTQALRAGAGGVTFLARDGRPIRPGFGTSDSLARAVFDAPRAWVIGRSEAFLLAAFFAALSLGAFARIGVPESDLSSPSGNVSLVLITLLLGGFLIIASEPLPSRPRQPPVPKVFLDPANLTKSSAVANSSHSLKNIMEPTTLITLVIFGAIQLAVYVICVRKITEITHLPEPPSIRLRLLENEENLFDSGLYVGIGGTAAALMMQVLQMVEANLLAAYSSNLMGIICVALVKIGHVRGARRRLILESRASVDAHPGGIPPAPTLPPAPAPTPISAVNPFTFR